MYQSRFASSNMTFYNATPPQQSFYVPPPQQSTYNPPPQVYTEPIVGISKIDGSPCTASQNLRANGALSSTLDSTHMGNQVNGMIQSLTSNEIPYHCATENLEENK